MKDKKEFFKLLEDIDGKPIEEFTKIIGDYDFTRYVIKCYPFDVNSENCTSVFSLRIPQTISEIPEFLFNSSVRKTALEDYLLRGFNSSVDKIAEFDYNGIARKNINISSPDQKILPRNTVVITREFIEIRFEVELPVQQILIEDGIFLAIDGGRMQDLFFEDLMESIGDSLLYCNMDKDDVESFVNNMEDASALRDYLLSSGQVSFLENGSLIRRDFLSDQPDYVSSSPLEIDDSLMQTISTPNLGDIKGLVIPSGLTVIVGESYDGRIDLIDSISQGIYNHIPGDGREHCVTVSDAVEINTEPGRTVQNVDISHFIKNDDSYKCFTSDSANAYESQAASLVESLEAGSRVLIFDEENSSSSFLSSDSRLSNLQQGSSLCPLSAIARSLVDQLGISIIVSGSSLIAEFIPVADKIYKIKNLKVTDITNEAKELEIDSNVDNTHEDLSSILSKSRWIMPSSIDPSNKYDDVCVDIDNNGHLKFGRSIIDLKYNSQISSIDQIRTIGMILYYAKLRYMDEGYSLKEILDLVDRDLSNEGLNILTRDICGNLARPRRHEIASLINRLPAFRVSHVTE